MSSVTTTFAAALTVAKLALRPKIVNGSLKLYVTVCAVNRSTALASATETTPSIVTDAAAATAALFASSLRFAAVSVMDLPATLMAKPVCAASSAASFVAASAVSVVSVRVMVALLFASSATSAARMFAALSEMANDVFASLAVAASITVAWATVAAVFATIALAMPFFTAPFSNVGLAAARASAVSLSA